MFPQRFAPLWSSHARSFWLSSGAIVQRRLAQIDGNIARYLSQLDSADRQGDKVPEAKITRLNEKIATLRQEIQRLNALNVQMMQPKTSRYR
jgi:TolA-binding protein